MLVALCILCALLALGLVAALLALAYARADLKETRELYGDVRHVCDALRLGLPMDPADLALARYLLGDEGLAAIRRR